MIFRGVRGEWKSTPGPAGQWSDSRRSCLMEGRSLTYHTAIASRLASQPEILRRAKERVERWLEDGSVHPSYAESWQRLLRLPTRERADVPGE